MGKPTYFVTGAAGFIGFHLTQKLLKQGATVVGLDNFNAYYDPKIKEARNSLLCSYPDYRMVRGELTDPAVLDRCFENTDFSFVFHLAAQAGVRYSIDNPFEYLKSNVNGTVQLLEKVKDRAKKSQVLFASSSSVYGLSDEFPLKENHAADRPVSLYGATKRADEMILHTYSHLYQLRCYALRFFTVYGPWGRPDMALFQFTKKILAGEEIEVFNQGDMIRDFTYVSDTVDGMVALSEVMKKDSSLPLFDIFNIGCGQPRTLIEFIQAIEKAIGKKAILKMMPFQAGDVHKTAADTTKLSNLVGYQPRIEVNEGVDHFVKWYREYYKIQ